MSMTPIPKGALFYVSTGEYSNYSVAGLFRALEEIDADALREKWLSDHADQRKPYSFDDGAFFASLAYMIEAVDSWEWHLADYCNASEMHISHHNLTE